MLSDILLAAGFDAQHFIQARFRKPPSGNYVVYYDDKTLVGPDSYPGRLVRHDVTFELYEPIQADEVEHALEAVLTSCELKFTKRDREWIPDAQIYVTVYEFRYLERRD